MSGITLDQITEAELGNSQQSMETEAEGVEVKQPSRASEMVSRILQAETGIGAIGDYLDHPMNFNKSQGLAQILRGLTGMIGNLNLAVIDVVMGALRFSKERKEVISYDVSNGGGYPS